MKPAVAVTLIITGAVLVAIPPIADAWRTWMFTRLMEHGVQSIQMEGRLEDIYRFGCWLLGAMMIGVGVVSLKPGAEERAARVVGNAG